MSSSFGVHVSLQRGFQTVTNYFLHAVSLVAVITDCGRGEEGCTNLWLAGIGTDSRDPSSDLKYYYITSLLVIQAPVYG